MLLEELVSVAVLGGMETRTFYVTEQVRVMIRVRIRVRVRFKVGVRVRVRVRKL